MVVAMVVYGSSHTRVLAACVYWQHACIGSILIVQCSGSRMKQHALGTKQVAVLVRSEGDAK
jgi:hypothetical protein